MNKKLPYREVVWRERCKNLDWRKVKDWLIKNKWIQLPAIKHFVAHFKKEINGEKVGLTLPTDRELIDYHLRMWDLVDRLAEIEDVYDEEIMQRFEIL